MLPAPWPGGGAYACLFLEGAGGWRRAVRPAPEKGPAHGGPNAPGHGHPSPGGGEHTGALKDAVCSPAGSTIAGIRKLESMSFRSAAMEAVIAAWEREREMQQQNDCINKRMPPANAGGIRL